MADERHGHVERRLMEVPGGALEIFLAPAQPGAPAVCAAHPAGVFADSAAVLLRDMADAGAVCVNPRGIGGSSAAPAGRAQYGLDAMADDLDAVRRRLGVERWIFWGMSGGGWLGLAYALRHPEALSGLIVESACACFRLRLADPACILSPFNPSWRPALESRGLIDPESHVAAGDAGPAEWIDIDGVGSIFRRSGGPALLVSPAPVTPEMRAAMPLLWTIDVRTSLKGIRAPTLIIGGSADPIVPLSHVRSLRDAIAGSTLLVVEGGSHVPTTARRQEVMEAVRAFLRERVAS